MFMPLILEAKLSYARSGPLDRMASGPSGNKGRPGVVTPSRWPGGQTNRELDVLVSRDRLASSSRTSLAELIDGLKTLPLILDSLVMRCLIALL